MSSLTSYIYSGFLRHRRFVPKAHDFTYSVFMFYLDTKEIDAVMQLSRCLSTKIFSPIRFKRTDFHIDEQSQSTQCLATVDESVRRTLFQKTGTQFKGSIKILANLRVFGVNFNPLSSYYCFNETNGELQYILAEVNNTPWNQRHAYVLSVDETSNHKPQQFHFQFRKEFHVSPFNPINMNYHWHSNLPDKKLSLHLENWTETNDQKIMDATLVLNREPITRSALRRLLWRFPWMTVKVIWAIYWQALKLWWKKVPIYHHPNSPQKRNNEKLTSIH